LEFRLYELGHLATIANAQVVRTLRDKCPDDPPELSIFAVGKLHEMIKDLEEWHDAQPWDVDDRTLAAMRAARAKDAAS
jgi:hypothetical protein